MTDTINTVAFKIQVQYIGTIRLRKGLTLISQT